MIRVLLVDDEYYFRQALKRMVDWAALGFAVTAEASNGADALEKMEDADLVLLDINIPQKPGLEVLRENAARGGRAKVVMVTVYSEFEYVRTAMRYGAIDYLLKPVDGAELLRVLKKARRILDQEAAFLSRTAALADRLRGPADSSLFSAAAAPPPPSRRLDFLIQMRTVNPEGLRRLLAQQLPDRQYSPEALYNRMIEIIAICLDFCAENHLPISSDALCGEARQILLAAKSAADVREWLYELLCGQLRRHAAQRGAAADSNRTVQAVRDYIDANFSDHTLSLMTISQHFYLSYQYLSRLFRQKAGISISAYLTHVRMAKAQELLRQGCRMLLSVARAVGYDDANYFGKCFKKHFGVSPSRFLEQLDAARKEP